MNRSRSKTRTGSVGRPKRTTRNQFPSYNAAEAGKPSQRNAKKMRVVSPSGPSSSQVSQQGNSSSQPRRKSMTETRRQIMNHYMQMANESPKKHGKVGSLQWMNKVLQDVNHGVDEPKDRVTNIDLIWWLEKHFEIKVEDMSRSMHIRTRSQSRERAVSSAVETAVQKDAASHPTSSPSSSAGSSSDEGPTSLGVTVAESSEVGRKRKVRAATPQGTPENAPAPVALAQGEAENVPEAMEKLEEAVENALESVHNLQREVQSTLVVLGNVEGEAGQAPESAAIAQGAAANVETLAADVRPATGTTEDSAAPSPEVIDLDNESNEDGSNESSHVNDNARHQSPTVGLPAGGGTHGAGESVRPVVDISPESPVGVAGAVEQARADPVVGNRQKVVINPEMQKLMMQMVALKLQIKVLQKDTRYPVEHMEVLVAQARAMNGMINLLTRI